MTLPEHPRPDEEPGAGEEPEGAASPDDPPFEPFETEPLEEGLEESDDE